MDVLDLFPQGDKDELFLTMDSKEYWLLLMVDLPPAGAIVNEVNKVLKTPLKSFSVKGLPPILALPKNEFTTESLAKVMSAAAPGSPLPTGMLEKALGDRDFILVSEPKSLELGLKAVDNFLSMHREWKVERFGVQLFTVTHRLYGEDYKEAVDFLIWMLAGIVHKTDAVKPRTDIDIVVTIADTIYQSTIGGKEKAGKTIESLKRSARFLEPAMKILDLVVKDKSNRSRADSMLRMWIRGSIDPNDCAMWVASNIGLYLTHYGEDSAGMIHTISEQMLLRIRRPRKNRLEKELDKYIEEVKEEYIKGVDEQGKIEGEQDKPT